MTLSFFRKADVTLASGRPSQFIIDCRVFSQTTWEALAFLATHVLPGPFGAVSGVPRGGLPFAAALRKYATGKTTDGLLVAEDVLTTGGSMADHLERGVGEFTDFVADGGYAGVCVFARGRPPEWVRPVMQLPEPLWTL